MISMLCPTRNRSELLTRMIESALLTADSPHELEWVFCVDSDDVVSIPAIHAVFDTNGLSSNCIVIDTPKDEIYSNLHNLCADRSSGELMFCVADDLIFRTVSWDTLVEDAAQEFPDGVFYIYPDDGRWGEELGTHGVFSREWLDTLGCLCPSLFTVDYSDRVIMDVARGVDRNIYLPHVLIEHMHWTFGKSAFDGTAQEAHSRRDGANIQAYNEARPMIDRMIEKLVKRIDEHE